MTAYKGVVTYTDVTTSVGERVGVCLFGSPDDMADWAGAKDDFAAGWSASAWSPSETFPGHAAHARPLA